MPITTLPAAPSRAEPSTFSVRGDAILAALALAVTEANALEATCNSNEVQTNADVVSCAVQVALAVAQAVLADASADIALAAANYKGAWSDQTGAATIPYAVSHLSRFWQLTSNLANVTAKTPGTDSEWLGISLCFRKNKDDDASPYTITTADMMGGTLFTNTGADAQTTFNLPAGADGLSADFEVTAAQYLKVVASGAETIGYSAAVGAAGGYARSNIIGTRWKMTWNGTRWSISNLIGTLNADE